MGYELQTKTRAKGTVSNQLKHSDININEHNHILIYLSSYKLISSLSHIKLHDSAMESDDDEYDDELDQYLKLRPAPLAQCPNPIHWMAGSDS
jgi:hypothetical protein